MLFFIKQKTADEMRISDWSSDVCSYDLKYDGIIRDYRNAAALPDGEEALHALDAEGIADVAAGLAREFEDHVLTELLAYQPKIVETAKGTLIETRNDIIKDIEIGRASCRERVCQYV